MRFFIPALKNSGFNKSVLLSIQDDIVREVERTPAYEKFAERVVASKMTTQEMNEISAEYVESRAPALFSSRYPDFSREDYLRAAVNYAGREVTKIQYQLNDALTISEQMKQDDPFALHRMNRELQDAVRMTCAKLAAFSKTIDGISAIKPASKSEQALLEELADIKKISVNADAKSLIELIRHDSRDSNLTQADDVEYKFR